MHSINSSILPEQIPKLIDNFQHPISYITLLDLSFFFLILIAFFFVFCGLTLFSRNLRQYHYKKPWYFPNSVHSWIRFTPSAQPLYCSSCRQLICGFWIFRSTGWQCTVCGRTAHTRCLTVCNKFQCKSPCQTSPLHHQLVQGNLPSGCLCCICGLMCWSPFGLLGLRCLWCNQTMHEECSSRLPENCDMGEFRNLVLSPTFVRLEFSSKSYFSTLQSLPLLFRAAKHCMTFSTVASEDPTPASLAKTLTSSGDTENCRVSYHHLNTCTPSNKASRYCESHKDDSLYPSASFSYFRSFSKTSAFSNNDKILAAYETRSHKILRKKSSMLSATCSRIPLTERSKRSFQSNACCRKNKTTPKLKKKTFNCIETHPNLLPQDNDERFNDCMTELIHTIPVQANVWSICLDSDSKNISCCTKNVCTLPSKVDSISSTLTVSPSREPSHLERFVHSQPLLVFVNSKSGGQLGLHLFKEFYRYLNPLQVVDIQSKGEPQRALNLFQPIAVLGRLRILVCGGDGTVGWVIDEAQKIYGTLPYGNVPVGILPLGTGNDLAHVLGWGHYFNGNLFYFLKRIEKSNPQSLDLWNIRITPHEKNNPILNTTFNNYVDIGVIARIALNFHNLREAHPELFQSRLGNKFLYGEMGVREWVNEKNMNLNTMKLWCDGAPVLLSEKIQGLIIVNIPSFSGGISLWNVDSPEESFSSGTSKYRSRLVCTLRQNPFFCTPLKALRKKKQSFVPSFVGTGKTTHNKTMSLKPPCALRAWNQLVRQKKMSSMQKSHILFSSQKQQKKKSQSYLTSFWRKRHFIQAKRYFPKHRNCFHTRWKKQCMGDEIIEVVAVRSLFHLGQIQVGLAQPLRICQGRSLQIHVPVTVPLQINGEPRMVPACTIDIQYKKACSVLSPTDTFDNGVIATITEVLDSAVVNSIVTPVQRNTLYRELAKRLEE